MSGEGILFAASKITTPELSAETYSKWYEDVHIPDILGTKQVRNAIRYTNVDPKAEHPFLVLYSVPDISVIGSDIAKAEIFKDVRMESDLLPGPSHSVFDAAEFDTRSYVRIQETYEKAGAAPGPAKLIISAGLEPAVGTDEDFDNWYREEHTNEISKIAGYVRTRRYKLLTGGKPPSYLAVHEFDAETVPDAELQKTIETPWGKKTMGGCVKIELGLFKLVKGFGETKASF